MQTKKNVIYALTGKYVLVKKNFRMDLHLLYFNLSYIDTLK